MSEEEIYKVVIVGEAGVGKTCILSQFASGKFDPEYITSLTTQYIRKIINFSDGKKITMDIFDTAGQEKYRAIAKLYYKSAHAVILVYDITDKESYNVMKEYWYEQVKEYSSNNIIIAIAANKSDLYEDREVEDQEGEDFSKSIGAIFASTSAKNDSGITALFDNIGRKILDPKYDYIAVKKERKEQIEKEKEKEKEREKEKEKENDMVVIENKREKKIEVDLGTTKSFRISTKDTNDEKKSERKKKCC